MREVVIVSGARTAVGNFGGGLQDVPAARLGATCIREAFRRAGLRPAPPAEQVELGPAALRGQGPIPLEQQYGGWDQDLPMVVVDEVVMGNVVQAGQGQNPARQATFYAGLPKEVPACTVNKVCASGMKAITLATQAIAAGDADVVVAGGMESMSQIPYAVPAARWGARMNDAALVDLMVHDGLWELYYGYHMGITAENVAARYGITREEQDRLACESHRRARLAIAEGTVADEIVPVLVPQRKGEPLAFKVDERPMDTSLEKMAKLRPAFKPDGTVTAGNASGINDGAAALLLMSRERAAELGLTPLATVRGFAAGALDPAYMGLGPVPAVRRVLKRAGWSVGELDVVELNEAFASQALACMRELELAPDRVNPHGSGISIGHPIGASGARITYSLAMEMQRKGLRRGLAALCVGGGMGYAILLKRS